MNPVVSERIGDCVQIRLAAGPANMLTTDVVRAMFLKLAYCMLQIREL
jgi:hypothetical protein